VRPGVTVTGVRRDASGRAVGIDGHDRAGAPVEIDARWVVGADGAESAVRAAAGIDLEGHGPLVDNVSILFEAPLGDRIDDRRSAVYYLSDDFAARPRGYPMSVGNPPEHGVLLTVDNADRWLLVVGGDIASIDEATAVRRIQRALGTDDLPVRILGFMAWSPAARVAAGYASGRLFVAGDAAHQMTPSGAFGLNVGIADAHNLAWKIAAVESGWAGGSLLATYDAERRPAGLFATEQSYLQFLGTKPAKPFGNWGVILGARYESTAVLPDGTQPPKVADPAVDYVPNAHPGARAPHAWLVRDGRRISTLDLYGEGFACLIGRAGDGWAREAEEAARSSSVPLARHRLGSDLSPEDPGRFALEHGIGDEGALVVRPDGHVAWRSPGAAPEGRPDISEVLRQVVGSGKP
jgi:putative polyketide hydroxylase